MKVPRTVVSIGVIAAAMISAAPGTVGADVVPSGRIVQSGTPPAPHLVNAQAASDFQIAIPRAGDSCAATRLPRMSAAIASAPSGPKRKIAPSPSSAGPVEPVEGPDGLLWLCRHDDEGQQCICIPWQQD